MIIFPAAKSVSGSSGIWRVDFLFRFSVGGIGAHLMMNMGVEVKTRTRGIDFSDD